ncbi:MAG: 3,4-dihydroxy-2-butanone-4-phosphate synthase [Acidobacteria bacterium]|nr:MAG: 3,4-dihydroxy-2-butanone-4-phosphate synthase [Acidobacteriota bacterium]
MGFHTIEEAVEDIRQGRIVIVVDDEERENEGDLTMAAEKVTPEAINFMATHGRGLICLPLTGERLDELNLPLMVGENTSKLGTAFTVSIEANRGVTTGISAADRATTILTAIHPATTPSDLARPGHVFPLRARRGGVLERAGQTEAAVDLARLAGLYPAGVICEVMNEDGTMARVAELRKVARRFGLSMITVADLIAFRLKTETFVRRVAEADLPTRFGSFHAFVFCNSLDGEHHVALVKGDVQTEEPVLVRVQSQSTLGDVFGCLHSESGASLRAALDAIESAGRGVFVYLRQEGKGAELGRDLRSQALGDTQTAALPSDPSQDLRIYGIGAQILRQLGIRKLRLLTNHPKKIVALAGYGLSVVEQVPLEEARPEWQKASS